MADPQGRSKIVMETLGRLHELAVNLTTSNLAKQEEGSDTLLSVCQALETNDAVAYHLAALAVELSPTEVSDAQELAFVISAAASPFTQMLDVEDLNAIYDCRPDSDLDCAHVDRSLANVGHYLCELSVSELTFPCLGCPLVRRQFPDWRQRPERATEPPASATGAPVADSPRHPGPPARRMMLDLTDAINQLTRLDLTDLPAESPIRRRLAYIAIALAQEASYGADINYCALIEMAQLSQDEAWRESEPQVERVAAIERTLYKTATGRPFTDPKPGDRKSECERVFQARDNSERFYCAHSDYIPTHLGEDETVAQMCQECPFHQNPRPPGLPAWRDCSECNWSVGVSTSAARAQPVCRCNTHLCCLQRRWMRYCTLNPRRSRYSTVASSSIPVAVILQWNSAICNASRVGLSKYAVTR